jgi:hypothetical protein
MDTTFADHRGVIDMHGRVPNASEAAFALGYASLRMLRHPIVQANELRRR